MNSDKVYQSLRRHLNRMPIGYPKTKSGVEIKILKYLFTPDEAKIALALNMTLEPLTKIHPRLKDTGISLAELEEKLDVMTMKGAITRNSSAKHQTKGKKYGKAPLAIGMYEFQGGAISGELEALFTQYIDEGYATALVTKKTSQLRTIPVNAAIPYENVVASYDSMREMIKTSKGPFAVGPCVCRTGKDRLDQSCAQSDIRETCLFIEGSAYTMVDLGHGRMISREEMVKVLDLAEKNRFVIQPQNSKNPTYICCCCSCCCHAIHALKKMPKPAEYVHSNFQATISADTCAACGDCVAYCPMEAISLNEDTAQIDYDRCVGCGVCVPDCPQEAIRLDPKASPYVPPETPFDMYKKMMFERFGILGLLKLAPKLLLGKKI